MAESRRASVEFRYSGGPWSPWCDAVMAALFVSRFQAFSLEHPSHHGASSSLLSPSPSRPRAPGHTVAGPVPSKLELLIPCFTVPMQVLQLMPAGSCERPYARPDGPRPDLSGAVHRPVHTPLHLSERGHEETVAAGRRRLGTRGRRFESVSPTREPARQRQSAVTLVIGSLPSPLCGRPLRPCVTSRTSPVDGGYLIPPPV